tara:strand:+ start:204 stop:593 length:390 start_codon:yes stop_codon:yes gene_type:complete
MAAEKERLVLLNRANHAPKLRDDVTGDTTNGYVLKWDSTNQAWYPAADGGGAPVTVEEDLTEQVNSERTVFTTEQNFVGSSLVVYFNGARQRTGSGKEVTVQSANTFSTQFGEAAPSGSILVAIYEPAS